VLGVVLDAFSRKVVGCELDKTLAVRWAPAALESTKLANSNTIIFSNLRLLDWYGQRGFLFVSFRVCAISWRNIPGISDRAFEAAC
jgi:hypothetical protein